MKRLIVLADDFGETEGSTRACVEAHTGGLVTDASLMAPGRHFDLAVALAHATPSLGVGVHLTLTDGYAACAPPARLGGLVDGDARLPRTLASLAARWAAGRATLPHVAAELAAQVERVRAAGLTPTHLTGHRHVHLFPPLVRAVLDVARRFGIRYVRHIPPGSVRPGLRGRPPAGALRCLALWPATLATRGAAAAESAGGGIVVPDHFYGLEWSGGLDAARIERTLERLAAEPGDGALGELMCHPGLVGSGRPGAERTGYHRFSETQALMDGRLRERAAELGVELVSAARV